MPNRTIRHPGAAGLVLAAALLFATPSWTFAAALGVCDGDALPAGKALPYYDTDGALRHVLIGDGGDASEACKFLSVPAASILWAAPLAPAQNAATAGLYTLQGRFDGQQVSISEVFSDAPTSAPEPVVIPGQKLLAGFDHVLFGVEERVAWRRNNRLLCQPGTRTAGVQLLSRHDWPGNSRLTISATGSGRFEFAVADRQRIANESAIAIGSLTVADNETHTLRHFPLPASDSPWRALTILCPPTAASLQLDTVVLQPAAGTGSTPRSAWVWRPDQWRTDPRSFWSLAAAEQLQEFFITVPVQSDGTVANATALQRFISNASARGISIWAVVGDRADVLPASLPALERRLRAYTAYNGQAAPAARLAGVQLDIEPYLLPGYGLAPAYWRERYVQTILAAHDIIDGALPLDLVLPVWWGSAEHSGDRLLEPLALPGVSLTVMNYRTDFERLRLGSLPFINWSIRHDKPVRIALETGALDDEMQRVYRASEDGRGELWRVRIGQTDLLVLFDSAQQAAPGTAFSLRNEREFAATNLTFAGDQVRLNEIATRLAEEWANWSTFAGIALHGLDQVYNN